MLAFQTLIFPYLIVAVGIFLIYISKRQKREKIIGPLQDKGIVPKIKYNPKKHDIMAGSGPNLGLFIVGIVLILFGLFLLFF